MIVYNEGYSGGGRNWSLGTYILEHVTMNNKYLFLGFPINNKYNLQETSKLADQTF